MSAAKKLQHLKRYQLVEVEWEDAGADAAWTEVDKILEGVKTPCHTAGYFLGLRKGHVAIASTYHESEEVAIAVAIQTIPVSVVTKVRTL